jgi:hypothetical protein
MSVVGVSRPLLVRRWHAFEAWVGTRSSAAALFALALAVYALESAFLPAYPGRDMARYLQAFVQLPYDVPVYPVVLATRGPFAAIGVGVPLEIGGWAAEIWLALLYALSIVAWGRVALTFGRRAAVVTSAVLLVYPGYSILFHELASDALFAAGFALWALLLTNAIERSSIKRFAAVGVGLGALVLVRPSNQVLLLMALLPLVLRAQWRERLAWIAASFVPAVALSQAWKAFAELRWGDGVGLDPSLGLIALAAVAALFLLPPRWTARAAVGLAAVVVALVVVRGWPVQTPGQYVRSVEESWSNQFLYRAFELDRIMSPDNGPASRRVARIVSHELLPREPYRSYGVSVREFFSSGSDRVFGDLQAVSGGPDLAAAAREAIRRHPGALASGIGRTLWEQLALRRMYAPTPAPPPSEAAPHTQQTQYVVVKGKRLPKPSEGQPIPGSAFGPALWTTRGPAREVWRSPTEHSYVFSDPRDEARANRFYAQADRLDSRIPTRTANEELVHRLNQASKAFPPLLAWLVIGLVAFAFRRPRRALVALALSVAGLLVIVLSAMVVPAVAQYAAPVSPAFVMLAAAGVVGEPAARGAWRRRVAAAAPIVGIAIGVAAAGWAAKIYYDAIKAYAEGIAGAQHDLAVFLQAAGDVLNGVAPYAWREDSTFAYPPFLAWVVAPLHGLSSSTAALVWLLLSLAAVGLALWWLELRDWRCYGLVLVFIFTRSSLDLGTVEPMLLLAVAAAWRWRARLVESATAVGIAIVLKLFLWPLAAWLALMRRVRAAVLTVAVAVAVAFVSWAAIGFAGLGAYPNTLRRLADHESTSSFSVVALGVRAHLPLLAARIISVLVALALVAAAAWVARDDRRALRDRDIATLTLCLAAALAASPIVWIHYFLLLLVPLALAQPRLSLLWLVPLAYQPLGEAAWASGDARKLALALVTTLVIVGTALLEVLNPHWRPALQRDVLSRSHVRSS